MSSPVEFGGDGVRPSSLARCAHAYSGGIAGVRTLQAHAATPAATRPPGVTPPRALHLDRAALATPWLLPLPVTPAGEGQGVAIIAAVAPKVSATVPGSAAAFSPTASPVGGGVPIRNPATASQVVAVPVHPSATVGVIVLAVVGGLLAGFLGSWRIASLRPVDALARVA